MTGPTFQNLSRRALENVSTPNIMLDGVIRVNKNRYDATANPTGIINMGVAENRLMLQELADIMRPVNTVEPVLFGYGESPSGSLQLRKNLAHNIFNRYFNPHEQVHEDHIVVSAGCSAVVDNFTFVACDPGDGIIITTPFYGGFNTDVEAKSKAKIIAVRLEDQNPFTTDSLQTIQNAIDKAESSGTRVRAMIISNPHNPLGRTFSLEIIQGFLRLAAKNKIHVLFDEIYALSMFDQFLTGRAKEEQGDLQPFISVLSLPNIEDFCPKELVHVAYGMSKDFCLNGFRLGCLVSPWNNEFIKAYKTIAVFNWISSTTEAMCTHLLSDGAVIDRFTKTNQQRLAESYTFASDFLRSHDIPFIPAHAGHFLWMDLRKYIPASLTASALAGDRAAELKLWHAMIDEGAYVNLGLAFTERTVGFFRLTFSLPVPMLQLGLERMMRAIERVSRE
ncbi:hypothetical protein BGW41_008357 [Actinomortierella wolfii]|nr:hypothetical protein BGW41_008357 [Actinomortierella wolfii]